MRRIFAGLALLAMAVTISCATAAPQYRHTGGGRSGSSPAASPSGTPTVQPAAQTPAASPPPGPASQTSAAPTPTPVQVQSGVCGSTGTTISVQGKLTLNGSPYVLQLDMADYHGPGTYSIPPERVSLESPNPSPTQPLRPALSGTVSVSPGGQGGTVDAILGPAGQPSLSLNASWTC